MAIHRRFRLMPVSAAVLALAAAACTDAPVVPERHEPVPPPGHSYASNVSGSTVTLVDQDDGETYTLNTDTREITRASDGAILELDGEQTAAAATAFYGNQVADAVLSDFEQACNPANPCAAQMSGTIADSTTASGFILVKESEETRTHRGTTFGASFHGNAPLQPFRSSPSRSFDLMTGGTCSDIVNAVFQGKLDYSSNRTSFVREGFINGVLISTGYVVRRTLPPGSFSAARFMERIASAADRRISISILGWMWNSYYCGSEPVTAGPVIRGFGGSYSGGSGYLACHTEAWSISFDGGKTYTGISVDVCEWKQD
jgi:hypothetical protein